MKEMSSSQLDGTEAIASAVCQAALDHKEIALIVAVTKTGKLARMISKYRPEVKILGCAPSDIVVR